MQETSRDYFLSLFSWSLKNDLSVNSDILCRRYQYTFQAGWQHQNTSCITLYYCVFFYPLIFSIDYKLIDLRIYIFKSTYYILHSMVNLQNVFLKRRGRKGGRRGERWYSKERENGIRRGSVSICAVNWDDKMNGVESGNIFT